MGNVSDNKKIFAEKIACQKNYTEYSLLNLQSILIGLPKNFYILTGYVETEAWDKWKIDRVANKTLNYFSIHLITDGKCLYRRKSNSRILQKGDLVLDISPSQLSCYEGQPFKKRSLCVNYNTSEILQASYPENIICLHTGIPCFVSGIFDEVKEMILNENAYLECNLSAQIYKLLFLLLRSSGGQDEQFTYSWMMKAIQKSPHYYRNIKMMEDDFKLSYATMLKIFKRKYHTTPMEYVIRMRFQRALFFLRNKDMPACKVANLCGFRNIPFFMREFRKRFGMTPLQYRKILLAKKDYLVRAVLAPKNRTT